jgi:hypothetical protein
MFSNKKISSRLGFTQAELASPFCQMNPSRHWPQVCGVFLHGYLKTSTQSPVLVLLKNMVQSTKFKAARADWAADRLTLSSIGEEDSVANRVDIKFEICSILKDEDSASLRSFML